MSTERETERVVRSWLEEGVTRLPDRVLDLVLDDLPATPQRRPHWSAWRFLDMNKPLGYAIAAAAVLVLAVAGYNFLPSLGSSGGPKVTPSPTPSLLARGTFTSHGVAAELDATGAGADVTGSMTLADTGLHATVDLECSRTVDGLIIIGGLVTDSTFDDNFPQGRRVAVIFQPGSPVKAVWYIALLAEPLVTSCQALVEDAIKPQEAAAGLEPIQGTVQLAP